VIKEIQDSGVESRGILPVHGMSCIQDNSRLGNILALSHGSEHRRISFRASLAVHEQYLEIEFCDLLAGCD